MSTSYPVKVTVDHDAGAAYVEFSDRKVANTIEVTPDIQVDVDDMNMVVGIELLSLTANIPITELTRRFHFHSEIPERLLRQIRPSVGSFAAAFSAEPGASSATMGQIQPIG
ncbi:DUF2283 domain-containing protein [Nocardia farcinica]|uniref:DUF2283 domain-containing protein n=1 Tax=Nocardia farcinica TaxID=37329 RepID=UPI0009702C90|nr:DUF2283 domain-containing protein [Nocardia farcinica]AXK88623.1 DUF2283 domain-containing protein [Nocardia farcinica]PFW98721.1 hypothetical protein CJ469_05974 [Nocardia farcinica]PFX04327.1 hypothetical protein CJ468_05573 [Nocardia farcinica]